jgi:hypothetical protein
VRSDESLAEFSDALDLDEAEFEDNNYMLAAEIHEDVLQLIYTPAPEDREKIIIVDEVDENREADLNTELIIGTKAYNDYNSSLGGDCIDAQQYFFDARASPVIRQKRNERWLNGGLGCHKPYESVCERTGSRTVSGWFASRPQRHTLRGLGKRRSSQTVCGSKQGLGLVARLPNVTRKVFRLPCRSIRQEESILIPAVATALCIAMGWALSAVLLTAAVQFVHNRGTRLQLVLAAVAAIGVAAYGIEGVSVIYWLDSIPWLCTVVSAQVMAWGARWVAFIAAQFRRCYVEKRDCYIVQYRNFHALATTV